MKKPMLVHLPIMISRLMALSAVAVVAVAFVAAGGARAEEKAAASAKKVKKNVTYRKTQEVSFDGSDIDGVVRSPDGAYLLQKQGVKFMPLYKVNTQFEQNIKESIEYLR
jgi:hypothetical protein